MTARLQLTLHLSIFKELSVLFVSKIKGKKKKFSSVRIHQPSMTHLSAFVKFQVSQ